MSRLSQPNNARYLAAAIESRSQPAPSSPSTSASPPYYSNADDLANMATNTRKVVQSLAQSIDAIVEAPLAKVQEAVQPLATLRPSWIGPKYTGLPKTLGANAMKQHVIIDYHSPNLQPPVYIFTSLSDPQWEAVEMQAEKGPDGQYNFSKAFDAEEGEYQYKFRLGPGDWWVCDSSKSTVDDGMGNQNNFLVVKPMLAALKPDSSKVDAAKSATFDSRPLVQPSAPPSPPATPPPPPVADSRKAADAWTKNALPASAASQTSSQPLSSSELISIVTKSATSEPTAQPLLASIMHASMPESYTASTASGAPPKPLTTREVVAPSAEAQSHQTPDRETDDPVEQDDDQDAPTDQNGDNSTTTIATTTHESDSSTNSDNDDEPHTSPLLRHESLRPSIKEETHAPLFRHESISVHNTRPDLASMTMSPDKHAIHESIDSHIPKEADPEDTSLVPFPKDHAGVLEAIKQTTKSLPANTHSGHESPLSQVTSRSSGCSPSLASVSEEVDNHTEELMEKIREAEEKEYEREQANGEEIDTLTEGELADNEPEDNDFEPKVIREVDVVVVEAVERPKNMIESLMDVIVTQPKAFAITMGLLALTASIAYMQCFRRPETS